MKLEISELCERFPNYRVALIVAQDLDVAPQRPAALADRIAKVEADASAAFSGRLSGEIPEVADWRAAYRGFGIKRTSYRSSVERLIRQIQQGRGLPAINSLVDTYNAMSVVYRMPMGADDLALVSGDLAFRFSQPTDSFIALGDADHSENPPKPGEVVYADEEKVLCRRWNWYQDARSATSTATKRAVLTVQSVSADADVDAAADQLCAWLTEFCGARTDYAIADAARPAVEAG